MNPAVLDAALAAETDGRYLESLALAQAFLTQAPQHPDALNLLGRLCAGGGDLASAIGLQRLVLRLEPDHARAANDLAAALSAVPDAAGARDALADAFAREPDLAVHHRAPGASPPLADHGAVRALVERALALDPGAARAHAALGNLLARELLFAEAIVAYRRALTLDPEDAALHLAVAELAHTLGDDASAQEHRAAALARRTAYDEPAGEHAVRVLALHAAAPWSEHVPLDALADRARWVPRRHYLTGDATLENVAGYDVVVNAMSASENARPAVARAERFIAEQTKPVLNAPAALAGSARHTLARTLRDVAHCVVPEATRCTAARLRAVPDDAASVEGLAFPLVIRPVDAHGGKGLARIDDGAALAAYVAASSAEAFDLARYVETRDAAGWYRKYRVFLVDGRPFPYHLAFNRDWIVHYHRGATAQDAWMRDEEARFVASPETVFPRWDTTFGAIARALTLDFVGLDCAPHPNGDVLIFEADPASWLHAHDPEGIAPYRGDALARIAEALASAIERRARG